jgi:F0F1-type ATP synthase membrane subunit a
MMARLSGGCMTAARWMVARVVGVKRRLSGNITAPRWVVAVIATMVAAVLVPGWITMMLLLQSVQSVSDDL